MNFYSKLVFNKFLVIFSAPFRTDTHSIVGTVYKNLECIGTFPFEYRYPSWLKELLVCNNADHVVKRKKPCNYQNNNSSGIRPSSLIIKFNKTYLKVENFTVYDL